MPRIPAAIYLRMSSDKQEFSIADQRAAVLAWAEKHGYVIVAEFLDEGISGWKDTRDGFQKLIAAASTGRFQAVLCWDQDRFSRFPPLEANHYWFLLDKAGVHLATVNQGRLDWTTLGGWLTASVTQFGKAEYCRDLAKNVTRGLRRRRMEGKWVGPPPFGYMIGDDGKLALGDDDKIALVRRLFRERATGKGYTRIAQALNREGIPTPRGALWSITHIQQIVSRIAYRGHVLIGKYARARYERLIPGEMLLEDIHPAIVTQQLWDAVVAADTNSGPGYHKGDGEGGPLSGLLICGRCDTPMYRVYRKSQPNSTIYLCGRKQRAGMCGHCAVKETEMTALLLDTLRAKVLCGSLKALTKALREELENAEPPKTDRAGVERQVAAIDHKLRQAAERLVTVAPSLVANVEMKMLEFQAQRAGLLEQLGGQPPAAKRDPNGIAKRLWTINETLSKASPAVIRELLSTLFASVTVAFKSRQAKSGRTLYRAVSADIRLHNSGLLPGRLGAVVYVGPEDFRRFGLAG
jgi:site-specific DNA recombinase